MTVLQQIAFPIERNEVFGKELDWFLMQKFTGTYIDNSFWNIFWISSLLRLSENAYMLKPKKKFLKLISIEFSSSTFCPRYLEFSTRKVTVIGKFFSIWFEANIQLATCREHCKRRSLVKQHLVWKIILNISFLSKWSSFTIIEWFKSSRIVKTYRFRQWDLCGFSFAAK